MLSDLDRESEYSPSSCIGGDYLPFVRAYTSLSVKAVAETQACNAQWVRLGFGNQPHQFIDLCVPVVADGLVPVVVFIHGGYWQELSSDDSLFAATAFTGAGTAFAAINYTLAPAASLDDIVTECGNALKMLADRASEFNIDTSRVVVCGSSAGAHLAAMTAGVIPLRGVVLVSGIYWLEPLIGTSINDALALDVDAARRNSPGLLPVGQFPPAVVCWGEIETSEFKRQSREFADRLREAGRVEMFEVPDRNHFDVILDLADTNSMLFRSVTQLTTATFGE
jgi:arylformamidase